MNPPITHYKDEPVNDELSKNLVNDEIEKEVKMTSVQNSVNTELKVLPVQKKEKKPTNASNIVNAFRQKLSTNTTLVELPSIGKKLEFKEISAKEQKDLSKISIESNSRSDVMYSAMVGMINRLSTEKDFDIRDYTEFERIAITLNLQQMNKMNQEIKFTCPKCNKENSYRLDTAKMLRDFSKTYKPDKEIEIISGTRKFTFTVGWANVRTVEDFFKNHYKKYDSSSKSMQETINSLSQIEYVNMFIKKITLTDVNDEEDTMTANLDELTYPERLQIMDCLPQSILFDEDTGVIARVIEEFVNPMNQVFKYNDCAFCGSEQSGTMANVTDFIGA